VRLLGLGDDELEAFRTAARHHDRRSLPGAVRASCGISTTGRDIDRLVEAVHAVATTDPPVEYLSDPSSGDYWPTGFARPDAAVGPVRGCAPG